MNRSADPSDGQRHRDRKPGKRPRNLTLFLSGVILICLLAIPSVKGFAIAGCFVAAVFILLQFAGPRRIGQVLSGAAVSSWIIALLVWAFLAFCFVGKWEPSSMAAGIAARLHMGHIAFLCISAVCGILSVYFLLYVLDLVGTYARKCAEAVSACEAGIPAGSVLLLWITAFAVISLCSKSSPLYPLNDWVDANCYFTMGKAMVNGQVLYLDIYEQKGPILYMLHAVAYLISHTTFTGVWIFEVVACFFFLFFSCKLIRLFCTRNFMLLVPVLALLIYTQTSFCHGDSTEELCLPLLAFCLYAVLKAARAHTAPSKAESFVIGLTAACVLWIKFLMLGFYFGLLIVPVVLLVMHREWKRLAGMLLSAAAGVIAASVPVLLYFVRHQALSSLFEVYFYNNMFIYGDTGEGAPLMTFVAHLSEGGTSYVQYSFAAAVLFLIGFFWSIRSGNRCVFFGLLCTFTGAFLFLFLFTETAMAYYSFILSVFAPCGLIPIAQFLEVKLPVRAVQAGNPARAASAARDGRIPSPETGRNVKPLRIAAVISAVICIALSGTVTQNRYLLLADKEEMPQYRFAAIMADTEGATLLNYGFLDGGFYTVSGIVPTNRFFCLLNISLEEMGEEQNTSVREGWTDYVVTRDCVLDSDLYVCVDTCVYYFEGADWTYRLYEKKDLLK